MTYTFTTKKGTAATVTVPVSPDTTGATLTVEFSYNKDYRNIVTTKPATGSGRNVTFALTPFEVDSYKDAYYRVKSVKAGTTSYVQSGFVDYIEPAAEQQSAAFVSSEDVRKIVRVTQAQYDALTPDPETLYVVVG